MNSKVHPLVAVLVILLTILAIGIWVWGSGEAKEIGGPAGLRIDPRGHLFIQIQDQLLEHDTNGVFVKRHDLARFGAAHMLGNIAFFSNGDMLVRRGPDPRSLGDNLRAYQRKTNEQSLEPLTANTGMYRCELEFATCTVFGNEAIDFKAAHSLFIDGKTNEVYVSDTTRHLLRKYSPTGEALSEPIGGFKFPNQLLLLGSELFVADTNNHRIRVVDPRTGTFGDELDSIDVVPGDARDNYQIWPTHIAQVGNQWWVNNMRSAMNEGGIYLFDEKWQFERKVALPDGADPIAIIPFHGTVLISDWNNDRIHQVSTSGEVMTDFTSTGFEQMIEESRQKRLKFEMYGYGGVVIFVLTIAGLFVRGLASNMSTEPARKSATQSHRSDPSRNDVLSIEPDPKTVRKIQFGLRIGLALLIVLDLSIVTVVIYYANVQVGLQLLLPAALITLIYFPVARISLANIRTAIRVTNDEVTLRDHRGRESSCAVKDVFYDHTAIATGDMAAFFGKPPMPIYDLDVVKDQLFPRLVNAQRVSVWTMQKRLFQIRHPQGVMGSLLLVALVAASIAMLAWYASGH